MSEIHKEDCPETTIDKCDITDSYKEYTELCISKGINRQTNWRLHYL